MAFIDIEEDAAPTNPSANRYRLYVDSVDGLLTLKDSSGAESKYQSLTNINHLAFNTAPSVPPYAEGNVYWNATDKTLNIEVGFDDVALQVGQEQHFRGANNTGITITNGQVVYISGISAGVPEVSLAKADDFSTAQSIAIATHDIEDGTSGIFTTFGLVRDVDTSSFGAGDVVYLSASVAGAFTNTVPANPNVAAILGRVTVVNATTGVIFVDILRPADYFSVNNLRIDEHVSIGANSTTYTLAGTAYEWDFASFEEGLNDLVQFIAHRSSAINFVSPWMLFSRSRGTIASQTVVANGDTLGAILFTGHDGTDYEQAAQITCVVDGTPGAGDMPGRIVFSVSPDGTSTPIQTLNVNADGSLSFCRQIATPSTPPAGQGKLYMKADNKLYFLNSSGVETALW